MQLTWLARLSETVCVGEVFDLALLVLRVIFRLGQPVLHPPQLLPVVYIELILRTRGTCTSEISRRLIGSDSGWRIPTSFPLTKTSSSRPWPWLCLLSLASLVCSEMLGALTRGYSWIVSPSCRTTYTISAFNNSHAVCIQFRHFAPSTILFVRCAVPCCVLLCCR